MNISHWPLGRRLALAFGGVIAIFLVVIGVAIQSQNHIKAASGMNIHTYRVLEEARRMLLGVVNMETGARGYLLSGDAAFLDPWNQGREAFESAWQSLRSLTADNPEQQKRLDVLRARQADFAEVMQSLQDMRRDVDAGKVTMEAFVSEFGKARGKAAMDDFRTMQTEFSKAERDLLDVRLADAEDARATALAAEVGGTALAVVVALLLSLWVTRSITRPIARAVEVARAVAAGDLTQRIEVHARDEVGLLLESLRDMNTALATVVSRVRQGSESVASASMQIAQGNSDLSSRTESQASALEETAASMEELGSTVAQNADNARQANQLAQAASGVAEQGGAVVSQVVDTMKGISESSRRISDIINVIDGIAFQTNILALNAAVEAARAGEQGRGFAVVAGEVRSLAQRSAGAAKEIKELITASVERVEDGAQLADRAGSTMTEVVGSIRRVTDIMGEISAASSEQSAGVAQVGEAVTQMDQTTQQNAALVEAMAAAASSLRSQAQDLVQAVSVFRLASDTPRAEPVEVTAPTAVTVAPAPSPAPAVAAPRPSMPARRKSPAKMPSPARTPSLRPAAAGAGFMAVPAMAAQGGQGDWESF
ncbi:methyl-accepting chemotaxis protein [Paracidovorax citrulli]|uniref:methyl-accepting chemotaxis protein n=1 Tax=Paracidovorax citrulli TaxID=80869 RepID=UPI00066205BC|nr:methyl-accepting chemotaxis protein [Paracidovorax citrulli]QCX09336.1 Methyl-accepting chemotaxis protein II [Paracidovorax citrulli]UEG47678.1 methyl-accepting chemotaxis protein [Paracidovorax citrulli]UMT89071.1 HAMP domain-containing protein [Paracidovorax citrulli]UMT96213.1 HAMP domain-containing protein [Paracidovorax citrulli]WIY36183.1 methyl-accepting chemotaxis protein [Paracidovorax citrulli]